MKPKEISDMAKKFEDNHEGTTLRYAWVCGYYTGRKELKTIAKIVNSHLGKAEMVGGNYLDLVLQIKNIGR